MGIVYVLFVVGGIEVGSGSIIDREVKSLVGYFIFDFCLYYVFLFLMNLLDEVFIL